MSFSGLRSKSELCSGNLLEVLRFSAFFLAKKIVFRIVSAWLISPRLEKKDRSFGLLTMFWRIALSWLCIRLSASQPVHQGACVRIIDRRQHLLFIFFQWGSRVSLVTRCHFEKLCDSFIVLLYCFLGAERLIAKNSPIIVVTASINLTNWLDRLAIPGRLVVLLPRLIIMWEVAWKYSWLQRERERAEGGIERNSIFLIAKMQSNFPSQTDTHAKMYRRMGMRRLPTTQKERYTSYSDKVEMNTYWRGCVERFPLFLLRQLFIRCFLVSSSLLCILSGWLAV